MQMKASISEYRIGSVKFIKRVIGASGTSLLKALLGRVNAMIFQGNQYQCLICGARLRRWFILGDPAQKGYKCPVCSSLARHRFLWFILHNKNILPKMGDSILHLAPEWIIEKELRKLVDNDGYVSADLVPGRAMRTLDITHSELDSMSFDWIFCSHVLEHIIDDRKAMDEMFRILKIGGHLIVQVPMKHMPDTYEEPSIVDSKDRQKHFGLSDHVRLYGLDIQKRLENSNFSVQLFDPHVECSEVEFTRYALDIPPDSTSLYSSQSRVYFCTKEEIDGD
jgi:predicted SAM-dependent methyltransferase/DNA-directed RNA polymerase subunit RPC12/RpoP